MRLVLSTTIALGTCWPSQDPAGGASVLASRGVQSMRARGDVRPTHQFKARQPSRREQSPSQGGFIPFAALAAGLGAVLERGAGIPTRAPAIPTRVASLRTCVAGAHARVADVRPRVAGVRERVAATPARVAIIPARAAAVPTCVATVPARLVIPRLGQIPCEGHALLHSSFSILHSLLL